MPQLEVQVRTGGVAGLTDLGDLLAAGDFITDFGGNAAAVRV